ncbi:hypothetical protein GQ457_18G008490 [Hibiscus cannabinus]
MGGDFNITRSPEEKLGVTFRKGAMTDFSNFIDELKLIDLPASGGKFTWSNLREEPSFSRLDRFLISPEIIECWPSIIQQILPRGISDHNPITLSTPTSQWGPKPFKWFDLWFDDKELVYQLKATCHKSKGNGIMTMLRQCKSASKDWRKNRLKDDPESIPSSESKCQALELEISNGVEPIVNSKELKKLRSKLWLRTRQEEREWLQKSRLKWFEAGDKNTKFFHLTASARRRSNYIGSLKFGESLIYNPSEIKAAVEAHFRDMYNSSNTLSIDDINCHLNSISPESSTRLERPFTMEEIISALSSLDGSRAPGPDGFNMNFLKRFWTQLKDEILIFFEQFQKGEVRDVSFNHSFIVLLPKAKSPVSMGDYRPISLVGSIYKLLSKVLANRLKSVSEDLIGETQFAFCLGKQILDCSLISNELIDYTRKRGLQGIVFKADFRKAYDTVDWNFLLFTMRKMGFGEVWCSWIKCCISTANISVLVNGSHTRSFSNRRGLRQGCPLSPLLFNIIAEVLSALLRQAKSLGLFSGFHFGNSSEGISHLQFADDLITFCGANETEWIWRYGSEPNSLWRRVIHSRYEANSQSLLPVNLKRHNKSWLWRNICAKLDSADTCFLENVRFVVGDGRNIQFWSDHWIGNTTLMNSHPRIFALACRKSGAVADFGSVSEGVWTWNINLRRNLFDWEIEVWESFANILMSFKSNSCVPDSIRWKPNSNGSFSAKSCYETLALNGASKDEIWRLVWSSIAPPKVTAFAWRAVHGRIPTRVELFRRAKWTEVGLSVNDLIGNPINFRHFKQRRLWVTKSDWNPPDSGELKFNTDGAVSGSFGEAGIGGCLRNNNARCLKTFSKSVGLTDVRDFLVG